MPQPNSHSTFRFGEFELDISAYQLRRGGQPVHLERHPMDLLILLIWNDLSTTNSVLSFFVHSFFFLQEAARVAVEEL